ncbi:MAG: response regulator [Gammaproteobacteria bacterium]|nr:response regulator [Gammaproteobacteria bacterium]
MADKNDTCQTELLDNVLQHLYEGVITINSLGQILMANPALIRMTGYAESDLIGQNVNLLMGEEYAQQHDRFLMDFIERGANDITGMQRYLPVHRKDGSVFKAEISVTRMEQDGEILFIGSVIDVSERVKQQEKIYELSRFPEENTNPVMKINHDGEITYSNASSEIILTFWGTAIHGKVPENVIKFIDKAIAKNKNQVMVIEPDKNKYYKLTFTPIKEYDYVNVYGSDISELKKREQELLTHRTALEYLVRERTKEAQDALMKAERANRAKSLFLANMSHEIRTPLSTIIGYSESLKEPDLTDDEKDNAIDTIIKSGHHLKDLISEVLDLTKIEAEKLELESISTNLFDTVQDVYSLVEPFAKGKNINLNIDYQFPLPRSIDIDPIRFKQILLNLYSNAIKFTEQGTVNIVVAYDIAEEQLKITVADTGIGISESQLQNLFEPFQQADISTSRQYGGSGLGLCLSRRLSNLMDGDIEVESTLGEGSRFRLILNLDTHIKLQLVDKITSDREVVKPAVTDMKNKLKGTVLLVEDTPEIQMLVAAILRKTGLEVETANDGQEALEKAKEKTYSLILMDIQMPVMDGFTAVQMLRANDYTHPIVALTANAMKEDEERCLAAGCDGFLAKPVQREQLYRTLKRYMQGEERMSNESLVSTLFETDPDMVDMVKTFLNKFPDYLDQCKLAMEAENWEAMREVLHVLKGIGGSYGYPTITETAKEAESHLKVGDHGAAVKLFEKLIELNEAAQRGYQQQAG